MNTDDDGEQECSAQTSLERLAAAGLLSQVFEHAEDPGDLFNFSIVSHT